MTEAPRERGEDQGREHGDRGIRVAGPADVAAGRVFVTGNPVTGLVVVEAHEGHLFLDSIAVRPDAHGRGVGRRLLEFVDTRARSLGLPEAGSTRTR